MNRWFPMGLCIINYINVPHVILFLGIESFVSPSIWLSQHRPCSYSFPSLHNIMYKKKQWILTRVWTSFYLFLIFHVKNPKRPNNLNYFLSNVVLFSSFFQTNNFFTTIACNTIPMHAREYHLNSVFCPDMLKKMGH